MVFYGHSKRRIGYYSLTIMAQMFEWIGVGEGGRGRAGDGVIYWRWGGLRPFEWLLETIKINKYLLPAALVAAKIIYICEILWSYNCKLGLLNDARVELFDTHKLRALYGSFG